MSIEPFSSTTRPKNNIISLKVIGSKSNVIEFTSLKEFDAYYNIHRAVIDETPTVRLNKLYKITQYDDDIQNSYKITREKDKIVLKRVKNNSSGLNELRDEIAELKEMIEQILDIVSQTKSD